MNLAYAIKVTEENINAIASEMKGKFDREFVQAWLIEHGEGYFLRDEFNEHLDCHMFEPEAFAELYTFTYAKDDNLFRQVQKI